MAVGLDSPCCVSAQGGQPAFLAQSKVRPYLSAAGQAGVKSLPPEIAEYIDRLKRARGL